MFSFFQEREASVKGGRDEDGDCHRGTGCPGASVQSLFCICILSKFISKLSCVLLFSVQNIYWNLRIFFISYLNHFMHSRKSRSVVKYWVVTNLVSEQSGYRSCRYLG